MADRETSGRAPNESARRLSKQVLEILRSEDAGALAPLLAAETPDVLADLVEHAAPGDRLILFQALPTTLAGEVAARLDDTIRETLVGDLAPEQLAEIVQELEADEALPLLEDAAAAVTEAVLQQLDPEGADELRELLGYEEDSAGRAMAFGAPAVPLRSTLAEAISLLRASADALPGIEVVFVVDGAGRLRGYLPLATLLLRPPEMPVEAAMRRDVAFAYTYEDQETAARRAQSSHLRALPIVDSRGMLRGQLTPTRIQTIVEEEASKDMYRMAGLSEEESIHSGFRVALQKRLPWLFINLGTAVLAAWVISFFESTIQKVAILAALQSIVAGQGGNAGIQTLTIIIRGIALGDLDRRNAWRTFGKELSLGFANGAAIGIVIGLLVWAWKGNPWLGVILGAAMLLNMVAAALAGFSVPVVLKALRLDPAQASGVFVTTVTDICGFFFFLGLATVLIRFLGGL